ncbi:ABC transporter ATP-binding protein [Candidatus Bathyarchaeota archaeon]|nr:MAG: ABC transporter ATP-binding protein [Candidatus Bathyarchaeota archaeon]RLI11377.1 MAG: ABC transporter ATP-binding protein [Candidatus Bathyarchaeota archaeon]
MLKVENLSVRVQGRDILKGVSLKIGKGEVHVLLGPNASGKSTFAYTLMGFPEYKVTQGKILFEGKEITHMPIEERAKLGIALAFQHPVAVKGVTLSRLLKRISKQPLDLNGFPLDKSLLDREINVGFSGGERKLSEILQIISLNPVFVILDEFDAGLDIVNLEKLTLIIQDKLLRNGVSLLLITHRGNILQFLEPDVAHVMLEGEMVCSSRNWRKTWRTILRYGYERCRECKERGLLSD